MCGRFLVDSNEALKVLEQCRVTIDSKNGKICDGNTTKTFDQKKSSVRLLSDPQDPSSVMIQVVQHGPRFDTVTSYAVHKPYQQNDPNSGVSFAGSYCLRNGEHLFFVPHTQEMPSTVPVGVRQLVKHYYKDLERLDLGGEVKLEGQSFARSPGGELYFQSSDNPPRWSNLRDANVYQLGLSTITPFSVVGRQTGQVAHASSVASDERPWMQRVADRWVEAMEAQAQSTSASKKETRWRVEAQAPELVLDPSYANDRREYPREYPIGFTLSFSGPLPENGAQLKAVGKELIHNNPLAHIVRGVSAALQGTRNGDHREASPQPSQNEAILAKSESRALVE